MFRLALALLVIAALSSVAVARQADVTATYARVDTIDLKIDLHLPPPQFDSSGTLVAGPLRRPIILWIHGGGWRGGHRTEESPAYPFLDSGYVVASIDYRFSQQAVWPAQIHDAKAAVRWVRAHADALRLDTARIVAWGTSAGGQLAALLGVTTPADGLEGTVGVSPDTSAAARHGTNVRAVVSYFGPTNFLEYIPRRWSKYSSVGQLLGCAVKDCLDRARAASPVTYVTPDDVPFLITHGTGDSTVPFSQAVTLDSALRAAGVPVLFVPIPRADHGGPSFTSEAMRGMVAGYLNRVFADEDPREAFGPLSPVLPPSFSPPNRQ
jgi:acetyl esterase/lipase